ASIVVRGEPASAFAPQDFARPPAYASGLLLRMVPRWFFRGTFGALVTRRAVIDQARCRVCGECARNCPSGAIGLDEAAGRYRVAPRKCIACYCCTEVCPHDAITLRPTWIKRMLDRAASPFR
ncbi:MAG: hypothetical protein AMK73_03955, partial [Planctomycetes bacterium SM23_32]